MLDPLLLQVRGKKGACSPLSPLWHPYIYQLGAIDTPSAAGSLAITFHIFHAKSDANIIASNIKPLNHLFYLITL